MKHGLAACAFYVFLFYMALDSFFVFYKRPQPFYNETEEGAWMVMGLSKLLETRMKLYEGNDFDVELMSPEDMTGFSCMNRMKRAVIHMHTECMLISEPVTGKYFCLPTIGVKEFHDQSAGKLDVGFTVTYENGYQIFVQIF